MDLAARETSFLAYDKAVNSSELHEEAADVSGAFMADQAGYKTLDILEPLIVRIYDTFNLDEKLSGYPSLEERKRTSLKVLKIFKELKQIYEMGNYLSAMGQHEIAIDCYKFVAKWYRGREVFNNIGVNYALLALNFKSNCSDQYIYPLEISWSSRLKKPNFSRGDDLTENEILLRQEYLKHSEENLVTASRMDPNFLSAEVNILCVIVMNDKTNEAMEFYRKNELAKRNLLLDPEAKSKDQLRLALALSYVQEGEPDKAKRIWKDILNSKNVNYVDQAKFNLETMEGIKHKSVGSDSCYKFSESGKMIDGIKIHRIVNNDHWLKLNIESDTELCIKELPNSVVYTFKTNYNYLNFQRVKGDWNVGKKAFRNAKAKLLTSNGAIFHCEEDKYALLIDNKKSKIVEYLKYN